MKIFIDSSVIIAALISDKGGSAQVFKLCEMNFFECWISGYVIEEVKKVLARKLPELNEVFRNLLKTKNLKILETTSPNLIKKAENWITDKNDIAILAGGKQIKADYLLTLDVRHFIHDKNVSKKSGLKIVTPGDFLQIFMTMH